jgi:hypothetical protein
LNVKPFKGKKTKKWEIEKYCKKNPLVFPIKITFSDGWRRKEGVYNAEMKEQSILSFFVQRAAKRDSLQTYSLKPTPLFKELH